MDQCLPVLEERAIRVLEIARLQEERNLVLGAWGCGVFRNDPRNVAEIFRSCLALPRFTNCFDRVRFSVLDLKDRGTFRAFAETFR